MSGIFGVVSKGSCVPALFYGTDYHSHLGSEYAGMSVLGEDFKRQIHSIGQTQFKSKFFQDLAGLKGKSGVGVISAFGEQPVFLNSKIGRFSIVTNGFIANADELASDLMSKGVSFSEVTKGQINESEVVAKLISHGESIVDGIERMFSVIQGACSLLVLSSEGIYAARDRMGYSALAIGRCGDDWAVATETCAFPNIGFSVEKFLMPGEVVLINESGMKQLAPGNAGTEEICSFLWIYTGFPASSYQGINVETVRERCGRYLARRDKDIVVDIVSGVPDSGTAHAIGYAMESGRPFRRPLVKYTPGYGRSYIPPVQDMRDLIAKMKL
ncbi:MAG: amidophosphoribosyltransferase, partial [Candidatus Omnitrophota bacterium]